MFVEPSIEEQVDSFLKEMYQEKTKTYSSGGSQYQRMADERYGPEWINNIIVTTSMSNFISTISFSSEEEEEEEGQRPNYHCTFYCHRPFFKKNPVDFLLFLIKIPLGPWCQFRINFPKSMNQVDIIQYCSDILVAAKKCEKEVSLDDFELYISFRTLIFTLKKHNKVDEEKKNQRDELVHDDKKTRPPSVDPFDTFSCSETDYFI